MVADWVGGCILILVSGPVLFEIRYQILVLGDRPGPELNNQIILNFMLPNMIHVCDLYEWTLKYIFGLDLDIPKKYSSAACFNLMFWQRKKTAI